MISQKRHHRVWLATPPPLEERSCCSSKKLPQARSGRLSQEGQQGLDLRHGQVEAMLLLLRLFGDGKLCSIVVYCKRIPASVSQC